MNPISDTAYYGCGIRMLDAQSRRPVCNDVYAQRFMDHRGQELMRRFGAEPRPNLANVARHRYIDDELRRRLAADSSLRIVLIGCGFDSRAFRLAGGEWIELDEPPLIEEKNAKLPVASCANRLVRIPIEFATETLESKLASHSKESATLVVLEGISMYLPSTALERSLRELRKLFPKHEVIADLMTRDFADTHGRRFKEIITEIGVNFDPPSEPAKPFVRAGYREVKSDSVIGSGLSYQRLGWLRPLMKLAYPDVVAGYTVRTFA